MEPWVIIAYEDSDSEDHYYWSNCGGWVKLEDATRFFDADVLHAQLPYGGAWLPLDRAIVEYQV